MYDEFGTKTFRHLYARCLDLGEGIHPLGGNDFAMQVYSGVTQVNICKRDEYGGYLSMGNFVFRPDEDVVIMFPCPTPGYCDYRQGHRYPLDTRIVGNYPIDQYSLITSVILDFIGLIG